MSVGLLIITHNHIGDILLNTAKSTVGKCPLPTSTLVVSGKCDPDEVFDEARRKHKRLNDGDGVLVLTDMYGSTPSNIARRLLSLPDTQVIAGVNLPMLIRVLNYPDLKLHELVNKAVTGGHDGILLCEAEDLLNDK